MLGLGPAVAIRLVKSVDQMVRDTQPGQLAHAPQPRNRGHGHDARDEWDVYSGQPSLLDERRIIRRIEEHLRDREVRAQALLRQQHVDVFVSGL